MLELPDSSGVLLPSFEVASIKPTRGGIGVAIWGNINPPAGPVNRIALTNRTTKQLIELAYNIQDSQLSGGPSWIGSERFDIDAKVEDSIVAEAVAKKLTRTQQLDQVRLMLQSLLAGRFKLKVSHQTRELPVYELLVSKGGLKIKSITVPPPVSPGASPQALPPPPAGESMFVVLGPTNIFADAISRMPGVDGRVVLEKTGLKGDFFGPLTGRQRAKRGYPAMHPSLILPGLRSSRQSKSSLV